MNTWQTELLKELRTQPQNVNLDQVITELESGAPDHEMIAEELHNIGLGYFAQKTMELYYHERAKAENENSE